MILPDIPRLYTALAEILGAVLYAQAAPSRTAKPVYWGITAGCGALLAAFPPACGENTVDLIHRFARETEHAEPNLARFARFAGPRRQKLFFALLLKP